MSSHTVTQIVWMLKGKREFRLGSQQPLYALRLLQRCCNGGSGEEMRAREPIEIAGGPERTRTSDLRFRKPLLYPAELRDQEEYVVSQAPFWIEIPSSGCFRI